MAATENDLRWMRRAIELASQCEPADPERIPPVGAVFAIGDVRIGEGKRGSGRTNDDDEHAEWNALQTVLDRKEMPRATVYTTLEPCTRDVRTRSHLACVELIKRNEVKKVFVGALDPNQGVCGKGVIALQQSGIEVEFFPHELARQVRVIMERFAAGQQTLSVRILSPDNGQEIEQTTSDGQTWLARVPLTCSCITPPGADVRIVVEHVGLWYPQRETLRRPDDVSDWSATITLGGSEGERRIHVVKANALGNVLLNYYSDVVNRNVRRTERLRELLRESDFDPSRLRQLPGEWQGIAMQELPRGLDSQGSVRIQVVRRPG